MVSHWSCLGELDIILPLLGVALLLSCFGNSTYVPWQEDGLERRCEVEVLRMDCQKEFGPEDGLQEVRR
jgi:hypothetical protein